MDIMLEIVSRQKFSATFPTSHVFGEAGGYIGRSEECEWVLPDRSRQISRQHVLITFEDGCFYLEDISANGVFLSLGHEPLEKKTRHKIEHGEGFIVGEYTIMARLLHDPSTYVADCLHQQGVQGRDVAGFANRLSLNPLLAMEQEAEMSVRARMGEFDSLLPQKNTVLAAPSDHNDPLISRLQPIVAVPARDELIPEDWDAEPEGNGVERDSDLPTPIAGAVRTSHDTEFPVMHAPVEEKAPPSAAPSAETEEFFRLLGFAASPATSEERQRILCLAAELLQTAVDGMSHALRDRAACKGELRLPATTTGLLVNNNPLKFSPTSDAALACLLGPRQKGVLPPVIAMREGFNDLHRHHMGLLAGARAATVALLEKLSPSAVEARVDIDGPVRLGRTRRLWDAFMRMHQRLGDDQRDFSGLMLHDFARAYEMQGRTLEPQTIRAPQGEK